MTTEGNPNPSPGSTAQSPAPAGREGQPNPQSQGVPSADFDAAVGREAAGNAVRAGALSPSQIKAQADKIFNDKNSQYWKGGPDHDAQVALVFKAKELAAAAEGVPSEALTTTQRLANRALSIGDLPIPKQNMTPQAVEADPELKNFVTWADTENLPTPLVRELMSDYANAIAGGQLSEQAMNAMEHKFTGRLRGDQIALLRRFAVEELNPALARSRR